MSNRRVAAGVAGLCLAVGATGVAAAATSAPSKATVDQTQKVSFQPNRYFKDGLRWRKDVYNIKSGGTLHLVDSVVTEGPHTFTVVSKKDLPKTVAAVNHCKICETLGQAHGADPNSDAPPKFMFLENGTGENDAPPNIDRPGDSALIGPGEKKGESVDVKVTAKKGTTLYFMCIIHAQMQAKVIVH